jgi:hypothetical protein
MLKSLDGKSTQERSPAVKKQRAIVIAVYLVLALFGIGTGYLLASKGVTALSSTGNPINTAKVVGVSDPSTFKDCATGTLEKEGLAGEGTHKLIREGGPSQTAYLISSVVDMDQYVGTKVKVCGQTMQAKKVSWLMDVGRLETL